MSAAVVKVAGLRRVLPGLVLPPLSLGALEQLQDRLKALTGDFSQPDQVATVIDAAHAALQRNYPDMTREAVADLVGLENVMDVVEAITDVSGLKRRAEEVAVEPAGE